MLTFSWLRVVTPVHADARPSSDTWQWMSLSFRKRYWSSRGVARYSRRLGTDPPTPDTYPMSHCRADVSAIAVVLAVMATAVAIVAARRYFIAPWRLSDQDLGL